MLSLTALLPLTSRGCSSLDGCRAGLRRLSRSLFSQAVAAEGATNDAQLSVCIGVDEDDPLAADQAALLGCFPELPAHVLVFPLAELAPRRSGGAPLCWIWGRLAEAARSVFGSEWTLLIGDDVQIEPADWVARLAGHIHAHPDQRCIALLDEADPGFPSFLALHASHLSTFGRLLPPQSDGCNQGGDPFLFKLYRRFGLAGLCEDVRISNSIGGMEGAVFGGAASQPSPRYAKAGLPSEQWRRLLDADTERMAASLGQQPRMQVAVLVPSYRVNPAILGGILKACNTSFADVDVRTVIVVDRPVEQLGQAELSWLQQAQLEMLPHLRVRVNGTNRGASHTRNRLLDEAWGADYGVYWDDDIALQPGCLDAYITSFKEHPIELAFAGPSVLPRQPEQLLPTATHLSGVSFFWEAPATMAPLWGGQVPWAVTANMAVKLPTTARFREGFPGAGGGEDVDFCLQLGGRMQAVPGAAVLHPWWPEGRPWVYRRFFRWAQGDGWLLGLWPALAYRRAPNLPEMLGLLCACLLAAQPLGAIAAASAAAAAAGVLLADLALWLGYTCCLASQRAQHPCRPGWKRPLAAAEAWLIVAVSEAGRAWGQAQRGHWSRLCASFDWFAGLDAGVVRREQAWAVATRQAVQAAWLRPQAVALPLRTALFSSASNSGGWKAHRPRQGPSGRRRPLAAAVAAAEDVPPAAAPTADGEAEPKRAGKRKVALYLGYEGTAYRGLQMQTSTAPSETVEDALEEAIFRAGGILASNRGQPSKVSWSRSSRTDKSVHSLATVIAMKMEVEPSSFETDPEGQALAAAINSNLPPEVRVFSIQRVSKSWNARSECIRRCYNYYLPASILGLQLDGSEADAARLALLKTAWERFQGTHPFHNYTKRRLYREPAAASDGRRKGRRDRRGEEAEESESGSEADESEVEGGPAAAMVAGSSSSESSQAEGGAAADASSTSEASSLAEASSSSSELADGLPAGEQQEEGGEVRRRHQVQLQWKHERDNADPVTRRHHRYIEWCRADIDPKPLVPGGEPCVLLSLQGGSFMLHQIRHMVGTAVAVARGRLPLELLDASMATPARMNLPLAPPSTLMLMAALFSPFKRSYTGEVAAAAQWTGDTLQLREAGQAAQQAFLQECMLPALNGLLAGEEWQRWAEDLDRLWVDETQLDELLSAYRAQQARKAAAIAECELKQR